MSLGSCLFKEAGASVWLGRTGSAGVVFPGDELGPFEISLKLIV